MIHKLHINISYFNNFFKEIFPELQLDQHVTAWTASWVNGNHWAYFHGHYLFLHEDKYYMRNKNNKITTQKRQKDKQRSTRHKYRVTQRGELRCSGRVSSGTRRVNQVTNAVSLGLFSWSLFIFT
jgi:hypothetical protein